MNEPSNRTTFATTISNTLTPFADRCRDVAGVDAIGVMLVTSTTQLEVIAWSSDARPYLAALELQTRQGPCLDSYRTNQAVAIGDLSGAETARRWPLFAPVAARAGLSGAGAVPMRLGHRVVGGLSLLRCHPAPIEAETLSAVLEMADRKMVEMLRNATDRWTGQGHGERLTNMRRDRAIEPPGGTIAGLVDRRIDEAPAQLRDRTRAEPLPFVDLLADVGARAPRSTRNRRRTTQIRR